MNGIPGSTTTTTRNTLEELKPSDRVYITIQGDWWDTIAMRAYGMQRGNEHLMYRLLEANYLLRNVGLFPAGIPVIVPAVETTTEISLVPWKTTSLLTNQ